MLDSQNLSARRRVSLPPSEKFTGAGPAACHARLGPPPLRRPARRPRRGQGARYNRASQRAMPKRTLGHRRRSRDNAPSRIPTGERLQHLFEWRDRDLDWGDNGYIRAAGCGSKSHSPIGCEDARGWVGCVLETDSTTVQMGRRQGCYGARAGAAVRTQGGLRAKRSSAVPLAAPAAVEV